MKKNFYVLLAIVGINQILSLRLRRGYNVALNDQDYKQLLADVAGFGDAVTLSDIQTLPEISEKNESLHQCYLNYKTLYQNEIRIYSQKFIDFGAYLNKNLERYYLTQVNAARQQLCNTVKSIKKFPDELLEALNVYSTVKEVLKNKSSEVERYLEAFYVALLGIHKSRDKKASHFHYKFKNIADEMKAKFKTVFQKITKCMNGED